MVSGVWFYGFDAGHGGLNARHSERGFGESPDSGGKRVITCQPSGRKNASCKPERAAPVTARKRYA